MIYESKSSHQALSSQPGFIQALVDALPVPVFYRDLEGIFLLCNSAFENLTNLNKEAYTSKTAGEIFTPDLTEIFMRRDKDLIEGPVDQLYECKLKAPDGNIHDFVFHKVLVRNEQSELIGSLTSLFDITERKKAEQKLERARESMIISSHMLHKIGAGIVIVNKNFKIIDSNESFAELMGDETRELYETIPGLRGADITELVPEVISKMVSSIMVTGENNLERDVKYHNKLLHVSVITIYKQKVVGAVIRDMSAPMLVRDEIISRARKVNRQNIETVQKIAFLLGENAAQTEEMLNSIIQSYKYSDDE